MSKKQVAGYILDRRIGKGSYATVWRGREEGRNEAVAVKVISRQTVTETAQLRQEVEVLRKISHPNIVRFRDLKKSAAHFYLVLEYCAGGDLSQFLRDRGRVPEQTARSFLTQIAAGLFVLHQANVLHRDLKPQNILLSDTSAEPVLKIADFGFARALQPQDMAATVCGSPLYMAPEILRHEPYDGKADLWSVGAILYELLMGRTPFTGANPMQLLANIEKSPGLSFEGIQLSSQGQDFLRALLVHSPAQRLSSQAFMQHAYVRLPPAGSTARPEPWNLPESSYESSFVVPFCLSQDRDSGAISPNVPSPISDRSPIESPRENCAEPCKESGGFVTASSSAASGAGHAATEFQLAVEESVPMQGATNASAVTTAAGADHGIKVSCPGTTGEVKSTESPTLTDLSAQMAQAMAAATRQEIGSPATAPQPPPLRVLQRNGSVDEDYVVVTAKTPISAFARGRGPTPAAAASGFCSNLSRIAHALEQLASRLGEQSPVEALSLLLRALALLEKALNVSMVEDETGALLRRAYLRMLGVAEDLGKQVRASCSTSCTSREVLLPQAQPNGAIFEFAVQQAKEAAVLLSKGHEAGGWESACHDKLSLALLLLDLLAAEADGEDVSALAEYTGPIARLVSEIEQRMKTLAP
eukprot:TRINITY_DN14305_c0_g1_i1.p1 TRINITY_DN14305_c0_g1~~TRINITY_DN14305_c0_g1_i1.p1  ORF type:complete len:644 (-),score=111.19 TRINITY_DN14305_c0_g1_i1:158-2089(-)